jgi:hypothetical protein
MYPSPRTSIFCRFCVRNAYNIHAYFALCRLLSHAQCIILFCRLPLYFVTSQHEELAMHEARSAGTVLSCTGRCSRRTRPALGNQRRLEGRIMARAVTSPLRLCVPDRLMPVRLRRQVTLADALVQSQSCRSPVVVQSQSSPVAREVTVEVKVQSSPSPVPVSLSDAPVQSLSHCLVSVSVPLSGR